MQLRDEFSRSGSWLFRHRSHLPLILIGLLVSGAWVGESPARTHEWGDAYEALCVVVCFLGLAIRVLAVGHSAEGTSGRNVRKQKAHHLNTTGVYSIVRHPLYLGNFLMALGIFMFTEVWWAFTLYGLAFWLYYERIMFVEEEFLRERFGEEFEQWASRTPAFLPDFGTYRPSELPFSIKKALRGEYSGLLAAVASFSLLEILGEIAGEGRFELDAIWVVALVLAIVCYVVLRTLKKRTSVLSVAGR
jgi:protein-S-isoprenylcysteine O-methyltransferase Ste14